MRNEQLIEIISFPYCLIKMLDLLDILRHVKDMYQFIELKKGANFLILIIILQNMIHHLLYCLF